MKYKVINPFVDKATKKRIEKEYECTEARYKEIQTRGNFLEALETKAETTKTEPQGDKK